MPNESSESDLLLLQFEYGQVKSLHLLGLLLPESLEFLPLFPSLFNFLPLSKLLPLCQAHANTHLVTHMHKRTHSHRQSPSHTLSPPATRNAWPESTVLKYCAHHIR